jgi:hypothetical protein
MENLIAVITAAPLLIFAISILAKNILRTGSAIRGIVTFALQMTIIRALPRGFLVTAAGASSSSETSRLFGWSCANRALAFSSVSPCPVSFA